MNDDLTARITEALDGAPVHSFRKPIPGGWTCIYCGEASAKGPAGLPVLSGQPCRYAPGMGTIARSLLAEARDGITRLRAHVEQLLNACDAADETISMQAAQSDRLRVLLDAPSTREVKHERH